MFESLRTDMAMHSQVWIVFLVISSLYSFWWDIYMDWGLGSREHHFLRQNITFPPWAYYCAIVFDGCARGPYAIYISPGKLQCFLLLCWFEFECVGCGHQGRM